MTPGGELDADDDDATQLATKITEAEDATRATPGRGLSPLPPGVTSPPDVQAGTFGTIEPAPRPRATPAVAVPAPASEDKLSGQEVGGAGKPATASAVLTAQVLSPEQSARRREVARRKRVAVVLMVSGVAAAALAAAVVGIVVLWGGGL